jgi:hypothetical protein
MNALIPEANPKEHIFSLKRIYPNAHNYDHKTFRPTITQKSDSPTAGGFKFMAYR